MLVVSKLVNQWCNLQEMRDVHPTRGWYVNAKGDVKNNASVESRRDAARFNIRHDKNALKLYFTK